MVYGNEFSGHFYLRYTSTPTKTRPSISKSVAMRNPIEPSTDDPAYINMRGPHLVIHSADCALAATFSSRGQPTDQRYVNNIAMGGIVGKFN
jgi:hypothetical protein